MVVVDGVLESEGAAMISPPRRLGLSFSRADSTDAVLPAVEPALPALRIAAPPSTVSVLPPVSDGEGIIFDMLTFFI